MRNWNLSCISSFEHQTTRLSLSNNSYRCHTPLQTSAIFYMVRINHFRDAAMKPTCTAPTISNAYQGADAVRNLSVNILETTLLRCSFIHHRNVLHKRLSPFFWGQVTPSSTRCMNMPEAQSFAKGQPGLLPLVALGFIRVISKQDLLQCNKWHS